MTRMTLTFRIWQTTLSDKKHHF